MNEYHIEEHDLVQCTECDHISATPSSNDRHSYEHKERKFPCHDSEQTFAFKSELKAHKYSHRTERLFKFMAANCDKTFKCDSELQKHVKRHDGVWWYCVHTKVVMFIICKNMSLNIPRNYHMYVTIVAKAFVGINS